MNKSISTKTALKLHNTRFTVKGLHEYTKDESGNYPAIIFKTQARLDHNGELSVALYKDQFLGDGMNVNRFGSSKVALYTYTPFRKRVNETIRYSDITIIEIGQEPVNDYVTLERAESNNQ
jgi:hypothetical protein